MYEYVLQAQDSSRRRSYDYSSNGVNSIRSAVQTGYSIRAKPSRELYRPPVLTPLSSSPANLNPAAKEFAPLKASRSFDTSAKVGRFYWKIWRKEKLTLKSLRAWYELSQKTKAESTPSLLKK